MAYRRDLASLRRTAHGGQVEDANAVTRRWFRDYAMRLLDGVPAAEGQGGCIPAFGPASVARAVVAVRSLHRFGQAEGLTDDDPAAAVPPPKPPRRLPKARGLDQVQAMLDVPATDTCLAGPGPTWRCSTGRGPISEAIELDVDDVARLPLGGPGGAPGGGYPGGRPDPGLRVLGKGRKERIVPLGSYARAALDAYLVRARPEAMLGAGERRPCS